MSEMDTPKLFSQKDWPHTRDRWAAFWERSNTDRPCLDVTVRRPGQEVKRPPFQSPEETWFDPEWVTEYLFQIVESRHYCGEAFPSDGARVLMTGWTLGCGTNVRFTESTIWHVPTRAPLEEAAGWDPGPDDPWRKKAEDLLAHLLPAAQGKFLVTPPYQLPLNDLFSLLRGPQELLLELGLEADRCGEVVADHFPRWVENFEHFRGLIEGYQEGCSWGWPGLWSPDFVMVTQSDMSCMIGPEAFEQFVMRELDLLGERYERVWYHVDGRGAKRHVPRLLQAPYLRAIQYVPSGDEEPNGPAHLALYRQVQAAGRCLDLSVPPENVEFLIRHLRPEGVVLRTWAPSLEAAAELLENAVKWCGSHFNRDL